MDPTSTVGADLAQWARKMGFTFPDGSVPDDAWFGSATNTKRRRELWTLIMAKAKDRRYVRMVRHELSAAKAEHVLPEPVRRKKKLEKEVVERRDLISDVEAQVALGIQKIEDQGKRIEDIEASTQELKKKLILFHALQYNQKQLLDWYNHVNISLKQLSSLPQANNPKDFDTKEWLRNIDQEVQSRWFDPALPDSIEQQVLEAGPGLSCRLLESAVEESYKELKENCSLAKDTAGDSYGHFRETAPPLIEHPCLQLSRDKISHEVNMSLIHWFKGQEINREVSEVLGDAVVSDGGNFSLAMQIADTALIDEDVDIPLKDEELEQQVSILRVKLDNQRKAYELLRREVCELQDCVQKHHDRACALQQGAGDAAAAIPLCSREHSSEWTLISQKRNNLSKKHCDFLWHSPMHNATENGLSEENASFWESLTEKLSARLKQLSCTQRRLLSELTENEDGVADDEDWEKQVERSLTSVREKSSDLLPKIAAAHRSIQLMSEQSFGEMIPKTEKVNNLTFNEVQIQHKLNMKLRGQ